MRGRLLRLLIIVTSCERTPTDGRRCGLLLEEFVGPYYLWRDAGVEVVVASPQGGMPPLESILLVTDEANLERYQKDAEARGLLADTLRIEQICADDFEAVLFAGGVGASVDLPDDPRVQALFGAFAAAGKPAGFVGYAAAILLKLRTSSGAPYARARAVTGVTNSERRSLEPAAPSGPSLASALKRQSAIYTAAADGLSHVVRDGLLVTGQNTRSAVGVARALLDIAGQVG